MQVRVARVVKAHGLRGEVVLDVLTDSPERRFVPGAVIRTEAAPGTPLTIATTRQHQGRWLVLFTGVADRTAAEALRGTILVTESDDEGSEEDAWYPSELVGLRVERLDGELLGEVIGLEHMPAHDLLEVREPDGTRTLVPFVTAIVPTVDVAGGRVVVDPPGGLFAVDADKVIEDR